MVEFIFDVNCVIELIFDVNCVVELIFDVNCVVEFIFDVNCVVELIFESALCRPIITLNILLGKVVKFNKGLLEAIRKLSRYRFVCCFYVIESRRGVKVFIFVEKLSHG